MQIGFCLKNIINKEIYMGPSDIALLCVLVVLLLFSAFFSSAETALTTVNKIRLRTLVEEENKKAIV